MTKHCWTTILSIEDIAVDFNIINTKPMAHYEKEFKVKLESHPEHGKNIVTVLC